jgi:glutaredoxin 3
MAKVIMYSTQVCPYCQLAEKLLATKGLTPEKILVDLHPERRQEMMARTNRKTVPQIFINDHHIGGYDDLYALEQSGKLDELLTA